MAFHEYFFKNIQLEFAIEDGNADKVARLLAMGANPNWLKKGSLLGKAVERGETDIVPLLVKAGADPKTRSRYGATPFELAFLHSDKKTFLALQKNLGLAMTINDLGLFLSGPTHNEGPLRNNRPFLVDLTETKILLENGAAFGPNSRTIGANLLFAALEADDNDALNLLINHGAAINAPTTAGTTRGTALHTAVNLQRFEAVRLLLDKGANLTALDSRGLTPAELARTKGNRAIMALLKCEPEPSTQPTAPPEGWILLAPNRVAHVTSEPALGRKITDIFNFATAERTYLIENIRTGAETSVLKSFAEMADKSPAERALAELQRLGGTADPSIIYAMPRNKQPLMPEKK